MLKKDFKIIKCGEGTQENLDPFLLKKERCLRLYDHQVKANRQKGVNMFEKKATTNQNQTHSQKK